MTLVVSTSSPLASVAWIDADGELMASASRMAPQAASQACLSLLEELGIGVEQAERFVADVGPGSFTGTRVGVVLVKTWAWNYGKPCAGVPSFDLISRLSPAGLAHRKGEWWVRNPGAEPLLLESVMLPEGVIGYGFGVEPPTYPLAERVCLDSLNWVSAEQLTPEYGAPPSISTPKKRSGGAA